MKLKCDLAKFGYRADMKVKKFENPFIFWLYCRNLVISKTNF